MPANLTAEAKAKWNKAQQARAPKEKIQALQEFLSAIPKHKGNERLRAQTKRKIALLKTELQTKHRRGSKGGGKRTIQKAGAAQIAVIGLTNVGRSSLLTAVTSARPLVAAYPYTTKETVPGMFNFNDLQFQLIELPALVPAGEERFVFQEGGADLLANSDGLILMVDLSDRPIEQFDRIVAELARSQVTTTRSESNVNIQKTSAGGIQLVVAGSLMGCTRREVESLLKSYGIPNAMIRVSGNVSLDDIENMILETGLVYKPALVLANKADLPNATENLRLLLDRVGSKMPVLAGSCLTGLGLAELGMKLFQALDIARIYTKEPSAPSPSPEPFVVKTNTTVGELSRQIHSALFRQFRYARVWGKSASYPGERVGLDHILFDGDTVEIHA